MSTGSTDPPSQEPRGAWAASVGGFIALFASFGGINSFGVLVGPMSRALSADREVLAWMLSLALFVVFALAPITGRATDRIGPRPLLVASAPLFAGGLFATSFIDRPELGFACFGLGVGVGVACAYVPALAAVGGWFHGRRGLGLGLAAAGLGLGTAVVPPITALLVDHFGWRVALRLVSLVAFVLILTASLLISRPPRTEPVSRSQQATAPTPEAKAALRRLWVSTLIISFLFAITFAFLPSEAESNGVSKFWAAALIGELGLVAAVAQVSLGSLGDRVGHPRVFRASVAVVAASFVFWIAAGGYPLYLLFALVMGVGFGGVVALLPATVADLFEVSLLGTTMGRLYTAQAVGGLLVPPAGELADAMDSLVPVLCLVLILGLLAFLVLRPVTAPAPARS